MATMNGLIPECDICGRPTEVLRHGLCIDCRQTQQAARERRIRRDSARTGHRFKRRERHGTKGDGVR